MILEIADFRILPGQQAVFEAALLHGLRTVVEQAEGFEDWQVVKCIEEPERYVLQIFWATLEAHTVGFRQGPLFAQWRAIIGPYFAQPPAVAHFDRLAGSYDNA
jgi:heme-degrading monooxygenase HmoA